MIDEMEGDVGMRPHVTTKITRNYPYPMYKMYMMERVVGSLKGAGE